ncbi:thioredoxin-like [Engystomops pustulosus]|uniref:thioredoxin-like n=1 Tax=Engystomops pustulosus TaxID=76066 RepID=UPI003AFB12CF
MEVIQDKQSMERAWRDAGGKTVVIAFISYRCGYCKRFMPFLDSLCLKMPGVIFKKVDVNSSEDLRNEFEVTGVPETFIYANGGLYRRISGADNEQVMKTLLELGN